MQAVITGEVDLATLTVNLAAPMILADKVTEIAITSAQRWPTLPDVPTISEGGIPEMPVDAWFGLFAPARTPPAIVDSIAREVRAIEQIPDVRKRIEGVHYRPAANTPEGIRCPAAPGASDVEAGGRRFGLTAAVGCGHHDQPRPPADRMARVV